MFICPILLLDFVQLLNYETTMSRSWILLPSSDKWKKEDGKRIFLPLGSASLKPGPGPGPAPAPGPKDPTDRLSILFLFIT
jgi:hypothetical protein